VTGAGLQWVQLPPGSGSLPDGHRNGSGGNEAVGGFQWNASQGESTSVQAVTCHLGPKRRRVYQGTTLSKKWGRLICRAIRDETGRDTVRLDPTMVEAQSDVDGLGQLLLFGSRQRGLQARWIYMPA
jgi:hypothetical protein